MSCTLTVGFVIDSVTPPVTCWRSRLSLRWMCSHRPEDRAEPAKAAPRSTTSATNCKRKTIHRRRMNDSSTDGEQKPRELPDSCSHDHPAVNLNLFHTWPTAGPLFCLFSFQFPVNWCLIHPKDLHKLLQYLCKLDVPPILPHFLFLGLLRFIFVIWQWRDVDLRKNSIHSFSWHLADISGTA